MLSILSLIDLVKSTIMLRYVSFSPSLSIHITLFLPRYREEFANIWTTLFALFPDLQGVISPQSINEPKNVITMHDHIENVFINLRLGLEATVSVIQRTVQEEIGIHADHSTRPSRMYTRPKDSKDLPQ